MAGWLFAGLLTALVGAGYWWTAVYSVRADANLAWSPGVRLPHVVEDRELWLRVHRAARPWFLWPGAAMAVAGPLSCGVRWLRRPVALRQRSWPCAPS